MKETNNTCINGKVYADTAEGYVITLFVVKGEPYKDEFGDTRMDCYFCLHLTLDLTNPLKIRARGFERGFMSASCRPATQAEVDLLMKALYEHDLIWDAEKEELVKRAEIKAWEPEEGELCWICYYYNMESGFIPMLFEDGYSYSEAIKRGWAFRTKQQCQRMCDKLNQAVLRESINELGKSVKEEEKMKKEQSSAQDIFLESGTASIQTRFPHTGKEGVQFPIRAGRTFGKTQMIRLVDGNPVVIGSENGIKIEE